MFHVKAQTVSTTIEGLLDTIIDGMTPSLRDVISKAFLAGVETGQKKAMKGLQAWTVSTTLPGNAGEASAEEPPPQTSVWHLPLPYSVIAKFERNKIETVEELVSLTETQVLNLHRIGYAFLWHIRRALKLKGLKLKGPELHIDYTPPRAQYHPITGEAVGLYGAIDPDLRKRQIALFNQRRR